jgi:glucose-1-phosphatase
MIKTIIFDVGGVLMSWPRDEVYGDIKKELDLDDAKFKIFWETYLYPLGTGEISEEDLWQRAHEDFGVRQVTIAEDLLSRKFAKATEVYAQVLERVGELKNRNFKVAILSNTNQPHSRIMRQKGIFDNFDHIYLSHLIGIRKPELAVFEHVLKQLDSKAEETLFIDDTPENVEGAKKAGMHTILARSPQQIVKDIEAALA